MKDILKEILSKIGDLEKKTESGFESIKERMDFHERRNNEEFRKIDRRFDSIEDALMKTIENVGELKGKIEKQDVEIRVIKGGKTKKA